MTLTWVSPTQAANCLGVSVSTVWRRVKRGTLNSRCASDGRREIMVEDCDADEAQVRRTGQIELAAVTSMAAKWTEQATREIKRARRIGSAGWILAGILAAGIAGGGYHVGRQLEGARAEAAAERTRATAEQAKATEAVRTAEALQARIEQQTATENALRGELGALKGKLTARANENRFVWGPWWVK